MNNVSNVSAVQNPEILAIDWDIHQLIELERKGFDEPPINALRRLLGIEGGAKAPAVAKRVRTAPAGAKPAKTEAPAGPAEWTLDGVTIPNGTKARFNYRRNSKPIYGEFRDGKLWAAEKAYDNLSAAANDLATTKAGHKTRLNGWLYWSVQLPQGSDNWIIMDQLRKDLK